MSGDDPTTAATTLAKSGLGSYTIVTNPNQLMSSVVVRQMPQAGVRVRRGTTVLLLVDVP